MGDEIGSGSGRKRTIRCRKPNCTAGCFDPEVGLPLATPSADRCAEGIEQNSKGLDTCSAPPRYRSSAPSWHSPPGRVVNPAPAGSGDPASLVPAGVSFYLQAAVQPEGDRREDALAAAGKIMRTDDPAAKLRELIDKELAEEDEGLSWEKDFASWLGEDAGVWATNFQADEPSYAVIVATKDTEAAKAALAKFEKTSENTYKPRSHDGIDYKVDDEGVATRRDRRLRRRRDRGRVQAHRRHPRGRQARRLRPLHGRDRRPRGGPARPLLRRRQAADRRRDEAGSRGGAELRAVQVDPAARQARADHRRVHGQRRRHGARHGRHRIARGPDPQPRRAVVGRRAT